ncbi:ABC transporter permease [Ruminiclostridium cellobioparum]|jgi:ABC-2 type transport system permease protein|uniref:ABC transporter permease n=1 Tax=Ruminiclostridium cellobioparum TaxID=29355 RepID=UPI0004872686|nr:ABC-2 family transporter protein [Ruminiclostridium cellobioparum]
MGCFSFVSKISFKTAATYRADIWLSILRALLSLSIQVFLWKAIYSINSEQAGLPFQDMVTYLIISAALSTALLDQAPLWDIRNDVRSGNIVTHFSRPYSYMMNKMAFAIGRSAYKFIFTAIPCVIVASILFGFSLPQNVPVLLLAIFTSISSFVIFFSMYFIFGLTTFWYMDMHGAVPLVLGNFSKVLSGAVIPLWYFPEWLRNIANTLPVRLGFDLPLSIYFGRINGTAILSGILIQIIWIAALLAISYICWFFAARRIVIQGG